MMSGGIASAMVWGPLAAGPILLALFVWRQARAPEPLMPLSLFRSIRGPVFGPVRRSLTLIGAR